MRRKRIHIHKGKTRFGSKCPRKLKKQIQKELKHKRTMSQIYIDYLYKTYSLDASKYWICGG